MTPEETPTIAIGTGEGATQGPPDRGLDGPAAIQPGTLLASTYRVERWLGGGGMGDVYLARHAKLETLHAVKVIRPAMTRNQQVMELFYREAKVLREVRHDAVVSYDGFVGDQQGREYLVMEYVEGTSLAERMKRRPCSADEIWTLRDRLCGGLAEAHRKGVVHRDLSPDNVILPDDRIATAKLIDFGLSKLTDPGQKTIVGSSFAGKYRYASPEQIAGEDIDPRSDIYSLGLTLAAAALGRPLAMGDNPKQAVEARQRIPDLTQIPPGLREWLTAMLQPRPADRPNSMESLMERWPGPTVVAGKGGANAPRTRGAGGPGALARPVPRRRWRWPLAAVGVLALLAGAGSGLWLILRPLEVSVPAAPPVAESGAIAPSEPAPSDADPNAGRAPRAASPAPAPPAPIDPTPLDPPAPAAGTPTAPDAPQAEPRPAPAAAPPPAPRPDPPTAPSGQVAAVLDTFDCAALRARVEPDGTLVVLGQVRSGQKGDLYDRLRAVHGGRVDVTAVAIQPWPLCAASSLVRGRATAAAPANAPRIDLDRSPARYRLGDPIRIRVHSAAERAGRIALVYVDSGGTAFHILPYADDPDAIGPGGALEIAPLAADRPVGPALLIATWCPEALYAEPPPEQQPLADFLSAFAARLDAAGADCASSDLGLEIRGR